MRTLIGIDIGTGGTKVALYEENGRRLAAHTAEYPLYQPENGWAEQNPEDWWSATLEGLRAVLKDNDPGTVCGIGLSGQMHGLVMLDEAGKVLRPSIIWCDQRTAEECAEITALVGADRLMDITLSPALTGFTASKILWVRKHEPAIYARCRHILLPKDYIRYRLTGEFVTDVSDASGMQLLDIAKRNWSDEVLEKLSVDRSLLARVCESADVSGLVMPAVASELGLGKSVPVAGGAGDNAASAIGCGVVRDGDCFTTIGTSGVVFAHSSHIVKDPKGRIHSFCSAVPGEYHVMGVTLAAGLSLKWFRDQFCLSEKQEADKLGIDVYQLMDKEAEAVPIGAHRLLYLPYLMGERTPHLDPYARGAFVGLSASHTRADAIRAVLEGVTYSLRDCQSIFSEVGVDIARMMACGGGSVSAVWRQMLSDVFCCPVRLCASNDGGALGAALLGGVAGGVYPDVKSACDTVIRVKNEVFPDKEASAKYEPYYRLYTQTYAKLASTYRDLAKL